MIIIYLKSWDLHVFELKEKLAAKEIISFFYFIAREGVSRSDA